MITFHKRMTVCWMKEARLLLAIALFCPLISEAKIGDWRSYTNMQNVRGVATDGINIWAATSGGVFRFNPTDSTYQKITNSEGLTTNDVTAIAIDAEGKVWAGQNSGAIDVFNPQTNKWQYIDDIVKKDYTIKTINSFFVYEDRIYIATSFGITVFSLSRFEFIDTYTSFSTVLQPNVRSVIVFQNRVFAVTSAGVIASKAGATNLAAPESWDLTLGNTSGNSLTVFNNNLYLGSQLGLYSFTNNLWSSDANIMGSCRIIASTDTAMYVFENGNLKSILSSSMLNIISPVAPDSVVGGVIISNSIFVGFYSSGIGTIGDAVQPWKLYFPNGPRSNSFFQLAVDETYVLYATSGTANGRGFYSFDGMTWRNYNRSNNPLILGDDCYAIDIGPNNSKWVSTWGNGLIVLNNEGDIQKVYDSRPSNNFPGFVGINDAPNFIVPGKISKDQNDNVWVSIFRSTDLNKVVWRMKPDSSWNWFSGPTFGNYSEFMFGATVDYNNTKWFTNTIGSYTRSASLVYFDETETIPHNINGWGIITEDDGVTNTLVKSIVVDQIGDIWIGTGKGITIVNNQNNPIDHLSQVFLAAVRDQSINSISVDALNNKWVGTSQGVFVLSPDGTQLLDQYSVANTNGKLVDNNVLSIAFDKKKGIVYFGTEKGLSSLEIASVEIKSSLSTIDLSPNPVYLSTQGTVEIRGLVEESIVKVLTINGKVLKQFPAQGGGRAFWDCKDGDGNSVASGVYIIVVHDKNGTQVATGKVAVIKR